MDMTAKVSDLTVEELTEVLAQAVAEGIKRADADRRQQEFDRARSMAAGRHLL